MSEAYVPPPHGAQWRRAAPGETGLDPGALEAAAAFAGSHETPWARDLETVIGKGFFEPPPWNEVIGEVAPRGAPNGLVLHRGLIVAEWGDTARVDMTFTADKTHLSLAAGRLSRGVHDPAWRLVGMALARLPQLDDRDRRPGDRIGLGRRPLGRRRLHPRARPGAHRPPDAAPGIVGRQTADRRVLDRPLDGAMRAQCAIRLSLVAQHRPAALQERAGDRLLRQRRRRQPDLDRPRQRARRRAALDRPRGNGRVSRPFDESIGLGPNLVTGKRSQAVGGRLPAVPSSRQAGTPA